MKYSSISNMYKQQTSYCIRIITILFLITSTAGCMSVASGVGSDNNDNNITIGKLPSYFLNPNERYPNNNFISAVGNGDTVAQAQQSALGALSQQINVSVHSTLDTSESYSEIHASSNNEFSVETKILDRTKSKSAEQLMGIEFGETHRDELAKIYVIAYIDRHVTGDIYRQRIQSYDTQIRQIIKKQESQNGLDKFASLLNANTLAIETERLIKQLDVISPTNARISRGTQSHTITSIRNMLVTAARTVTFSVNTTVEGTSDPAITTQFNATVSQMLTGIQFTITDNGRYRAHAKLLWNEEKSSGNRPTVFWQVTFKIQEAASTIVSQSDKGRTQGIDIDAAKRLAIHDVEETLINSFVQYITSQLTGK